MVDGATMQHALNGAEGMSPSGAGGGDDTSAACTVLDGPTQQRLYRMLRDPLTNLQVRGVGGGGGGGGGWGVGQGREWVGRKGRARGGGGGQGRGVGGRGGCSP